MPYCPNCGKEVQVGASFCASCGHDIKVASTQPTQSLPAKPKKRFGRGKKIIIGLGLLFLILIALGASSAPSSTPQSEPSKFGIFLVTKGPPQNVYTVLFGLMDDRQRNVVSDGEITLRILDDRNRELYSEIRAVSARGFSEYTHQIFGGSFKGYSWDFVVSNVKAGAPNVLGFGKAEIAFRSPKGTLFKEEFAIIKIPSLQTIKITKIEVDAPSGVLAFSLLPFTPQYVGDKISLDLRLSWIPPTSHELWSGQIGSIEASTPGFKIESITPSLPIDLSASKELKIILESPSQQFEGELRLSVKTKVSVS